MALRRAEYVSLECDECKRGYEHEDGGERLFDSEDDAMECAEPSCMDGCDDSCYHITLAGGVLCPDCAHRAMCIGGHQPEGGWDNADGMRYCPRCDDFYRPGADDA